MAYDNNNSGALFINDKKQKDTDPDFKGDATINNQQVWLSAWKNESKSGKKYIAVKFKAKDINKTAEKHNAPLEDEMPPW